MTWHLSARLAWHMDGWNGHVCGNPAGNTHCVGLYSYPGEMIKDERDLDREKEVRGRCCAELDYIPACRYSINAFGTRDIEAYSNPPSFFNDDTEQLVWDLPAATVCLWPFEEMYREGLRKAGGAYDNDLRLERAREYFAQFAPDRSLVFYYANYSNPFNEEEQRRYVVVGVSRLCRTGDELFYRGCSAETRRRFAQGFVWARNVTSHYPDQGLRIPYHLYLDRPEVIERILFVPDNPRNFKYGTRALTDDDALSLVERFLDVASTLQEIGDASEDWATRIRWLQSVIAELWDSRGLYPGLPKVLDVVSFPEAIPFFKAQVVAGREQGARDALFAFLDERATAVPGLPVAADRRKQVLRKWKLMQDDERQLLRDVVPRFDLPVDQIARVLSEERRSHGIYSTLADIAENPYLMSEEYCGDGPDDTVSFSKIDLGAFPSPQLGGAALMDVGDWRRLRASCVERLHREQKHTFLPAVHVIHDVNHRLSLLPEWKRHQFTERYLEVDEEELSGALAFRIEAGKRYVYLRTAFEDERLVETELRSLARRPDITFRSPVTERHWRNFLHDPSSVLARENPSEYGEVIEDQVAVCQQTFVRPLCVISGEAGTGKTTVIKALIQAVEKAHGAGTPMKLLAPTGKATERVREATGAQASTVHSFLAQHGWLNENFTLKLSGGTREEGFTTYIIDEASMVDLSLFATLFRAIHWASVQRLILVGDPNQLPPIGRGRIFADIIDWLGESCPEGVGILQTNVRQMENRLRDRGTGILDLASLYVRTKPVADAGRAEPAAEGDEHARLAEVEDDKLRAEEMLRRVQEGGDVDDDLRVIFWRDADDLEQRLLAQIVEDMEEDTGEALDGQRRYELWGAAFKDAGEEQWPEYMQVISPYRGEQFGTDRINTVLQDHAQGACLERVGHLDGITLFDKVIQYRNRPKSNPVWAYSLGDRRLMPIEVYNGELGFVKPHAFDGRGWMGPSGFRLERFQVVFSRKKAVWVGYGRKLGRTPDGRWAPEEKPEDNLELAYAISVHKSQGSEFGRVYFVLPKHKKALLSRELFYTGITRARTHCTLLVEEDISPLLSLRRPESSHLLGINSSLFSFRPMPEEMQRMHEWYEEGKIHITLANIMVRSKSEVIIANILAERDIPFRYEVPLFAPDGTFYLPDFTVKWGGEDWYWEHLGRLDDERYRHHWETKRAWYERFFPGRLVTTEESGNLSKDAEQLIERRFS